jgi:hypothetical protein
VTKWAWPPCAAKAHAPPGCRGWSCNRAEAR